MDIETKELVNNHVATSTKLKQKPQNGIHKHLTKDEMPNGILEKVEKGTELICNLKQETVYNSTTGSDSVDIGSGNKDINELEERLKETLNVEATNHPTDVHELDITDSVVSASRGICYVRYKSELQMPAIIHLITKDLSEPYSIYTYRYFIHNWPNLCFLAIYESKYVGAIVCKLDLHKKVTRRGYIAMLAVDQSVRRKKIGSNLVKMAIEAMVEEGCDEVVLETEVTNSAALKLYKNLGFVRDKRLFRYYLNGVDALRLKLWLCRKF